jgi:hypothetical protein
MPAADAAPMNQQGQLSASQRTSISRWLSGQQFRAAPAVLPLVGLLLLVWQLAPRLQLAAGGGDMVLPLVTIVAASAVLIAALYALLAVRRILACSTAKAVLSANVPIQQVTGTVVQHGAEHVAVLTDGRTWNLTTNWNVCREARQLRPGAYSFYSLRLPVARPRDRRPFGGDGAWLLSASALGTAPMSSVPEASPLLQTLAATNGFLLEALPDNRQGRLSPAQSSALGQKFRARTRLAIWLGVAASVVGVLVGIPSSFHSESEGWVGLGLAGVGVLVVLYSLGPGRRRKSADLKDGSVVVYEGAVRAVRLGNEDSDSFYYEADGHRFSVSQTGFEALDGRYRYRLYYLPRTSELVNIEPT